ncbi:S-layer homology domain-containing protein [Ammoniphilus sp. YIM 78166]|uniref:S-layer homology domain-containing protein n=1 Tax=Ammoniphilus sp. YIM 78166 TaxID=1644106 RepID=UPI0010704880|nr:S-layer homology domain-containing protein [Ammoniphilus sp. YIM 78166]
MNKWTQKILPALLAGTLTFSMAGAIEAKENNGNGNNGKALGKANQQVKAAKQLKLKDIDNHWAKRTLELMTALEIVKGYDDNTFRPQNNVTQAEAIVMVVRLLGLESSSSSSLSNVPVWAQDSVQAAIKNGIVTRAEISQPNKPATRLFVTKLLVNALGAQLNQDDKAGLFFKDVANLTREDQSYLVYAILNSLVVGYGDKTFQPNKPVTRAEMAVFIERLKTNKEKQGTKIGNSVEATISSISGDSVTVTQNGRNVTYTADDDVIVYVDKKLASWSTLKAGMKVYLVLQADGEIGFIDAFTSEQVDQPEQGIMQAVKDFNVELRSGDKKLEFKYQQKSSGYDAKIEVTSGSKKVESKGYAAMVEMKELLEASGVKASGQDFNLTKFVQKAAQVYKLEDQVNVELKLSIGDASYNVKERVNLSTDTSVNWGSLDKVSEFSLDVVTSDENVKLFFEKTGTNSYNAWVENKVGSQTVKQTGSQALDTIKSIMTAARVNESIDLDKAVAKVDALYDLSGTATVKGSLSFNGTHYSIDKEVNLSPEVAWGTLAQVAQFQINVVTPDETVKVYFKKDSATTYTAWVENIVGSKTTKKTGTEAFREIQSIVGAANATNTLQLEKAVAKIDDLYDLSGVADVSGELVMGGTTYSVDKKINVSPEDEVLGSLKAVQEFTFSFESRAKTVRHSFKQTNAGYEAQIEVTENGIKRTTTGQTLLPEFQKLKELVTLSDQSIDLNRAIDWVDEKYELTGNTKITGYLKVNNSAYSLDKTMDLSDK